MRVTRRTLESAAFYSAAFFVTVVLHEWAHGIAAWLSGATPVVHTTFVEMEKEAGSELVHVLAGPLFSLVQGLVLIPVVARIRSRPRLRLFLLWLAYHGLVNFVGYLFTTSFAPGGDLGKAAGLLGLPWWLKLAATGLGLLGIRYIARPLARFFAELAPKPLADEAAAKAWSWEVGLWAGFLGTPVVVAAGLPPRIWLALFYNCAAAFPLFDLLDGLPRARSRAAETPLAEPRPWPAWLAYLLLVVVGRLVLDPGIRL